MEKTTVIVTPENYDRFMSIMAFGMDMIQYNRECFSTSDLNYYQNGYLQMDHVVKAMIDAGYSPRYLVDPYLDRICKRCPDRSTHPHLELKRELDKSFKIEIEIPYYSWFQTSYDYEYAPQAQ